MIQSQLQGIAAEDMNVSFNVVLVDLVSLKKRPKYVAVAQLTVATGLMSGNMLGALLVEHLSWRA